MLNIHSFYLIYRFYYKLFKFDLLQQKNDKIYP